LESRLDLSGLRNVIGHVTIRFPIGHFLLVVLWNRASISKGFRDIQWRMWCNEWHDLKRPLDKGQGNSFWYQSIPHIRLRIDCQYLWSRTHRLATIHTSQTTEGQTDDGRMKHCSTSGRLINTVKNRHYNQHCAQSPVRHTQRRVPVPTASHKQSDCAIWAVTAITSQWK